MKLEVQFSTVIHNGPCSQQHMYTLKWLRRTHWLHKGYKWKVINIRFSWRYRRQRWLMTPLDGAFEYPVIVIIDMTAWRGNAGTWWSCQEEPVPAVALLRDERALFRAARASLRAPTRARYRSTGEDSRLFSLERNFTCRRHAIEGANTGTPFADPFSITHL